MDSRRCPEEIPGNRACRVAVPTVIHGQNDAVFKIVRGERAIEPYREGLFSHESLSHHAQDAAFPRSSFCERFGLLDGRQCFRVGFVVAELLLRRVHRVFEGAARQDQTDDDGEHPRAQAAARMSMCDGRQIAAGREDAGNQPVLVALAAQRMREIHAHRCDAHYAAASLAVVCGPRDFAAIGM